MSSETPNYGYRYEIEDHKKLAMLSQPFKSINDLILTDAPDEIDPRKWHKIENQGPMGSCQGHALSSVTEMAYFIGTGEVIQFSPLWCYYATQELDGLAGADRGSTISGGAELSKTKGVCRLEVMPYPSPVKYHWNLPKEAVDDAKNYKIGNIYSLGSYDEVFKFLASGQGGVEIGILWNDRYMEVNSQGTVEDYREGGGGHAVSFLGYSKRVDKQGRKYLWLANSWGPKTYGKDGWAEVSPKAVDGMFGGRFTVARGLSDMVTPKVRKIPNYGLF